MYRTYSHANEKIQSVDAHEDCWEGLADATITGAVLAGCEGPGLTRGPDDMHAIKSVVGGDATLQL